MAEINGRSCRDDALRDAGVAPHFRARSALFKPGIFKGTLDMDHLQSLKALLKAPVVIDDDIWHCLIIRKKKSLKAIRHLAALLQEIYKILVFNHRDKIHFINVAELRNKRLKVEIELIENNEFIIKVSEDIREWVGS